MTHISAAGPFAASDAVIASPGTPPLHSLPLASAGVGRSGPPAARPEGRDGPLRNGNPRGDPHLAPRCGAKARSGLGCRAPAMANGRCRNHGGKCTGPRTAKGFASLAAARTKHGDYGAAWRAVNLYQRTAIVRSRLFAAAYVLRPYLPPELAARVDAGGTDIPSPPHYSNAPVAPAVGQAPLDAGKAGRDARGRFAARPRPALRGQRLEREAARREAALLAPWRAGIAQARLAMRAALNARRAARGQDAVKCLPEGACPDGRMVPPGRADAGVGPVAGLRQGETLGQGMRSTERRQDPMNSGTVPPGWADAGVGPVAGLREGEALGQGARSAERRQDPMNSGTVPPGGADAGVGSDDGVRQGETLGQGMQFTERRQDPMNSGTVPPGGADAGAGSADGVRQGETPGQGARSAERRQDPMNNGAVPPGGTDAGAGSVAGSREGETLGQGARSAERRQDPMNSGAVPPGRADAGAGSVAGPREGETLGQGARSAEREHAEMPSLRPGHCPGGGAGGGAVRSREGMLRRGLLGGTVCNAPGGNELAALVGRVERWRVEITTDVKTTNDPARAVEAWFADTRRRMAADDAMWLRARCMLRVGAVADIVRWGGLVSGAG